MAEVIWTTEALQDVSEIGNTIGRSSEIYASAVVNGIFQVADSLQVFPESGSVVEEYANPKIREQLSGKYRIFYGFQDESVVILTVVHGARRPPKLPR